MNEIAKNHDIDSAWDQVMARIRAEMDSRQVHPSRTVVLVPYAQLMQQARSAWLRGSGHAQAQAHFVPRFETTMNWTRSLGGFAPSGDDVRLDAASGRIGCAAVRP